MPVTSSFVGNNLQLHRAKFSSSLKIVKRTSLVKSWQRSRSCGKMFEFEAKVDRDSSENEDRSRSDRTVHTSALQVRVGTPSDPISSESMSTPNDRNPSQLKNVRHPNQSPDGTLSQFVQSVEHSPNVPRNPFQMPPGRGWVQQGLIFTFPWIPSSSLKPIRPLVMLTVLWNGLVRN